MNENISFQSFLNAFENQAAELSRLSESISKMSIGLNNRSQINWKAFSSPSCLDFQSLHTSAPTEESAPFTCLNYLAEDQAHSLATELKELNLDPATSRNVINTMKKHLLLGIRSYLGCCNTNGSAMSPNTCPYQLPHSSSLSECSSSASRHPFLGRRLSADVPVPPDLPSRNAACAYTCDSIAYKKADSISIGATRFDNAPEPVTVASKLHHSFPPGGGYRNRATSELTHQLRSCPSPSSESCGQMPFYHHHYHHYHPWADQQQRSSSTCYSVCAPAPSCIPCASTQLSTAKATSSLSPKGVLLKLRRRCELGRANERYSALSESSSPSGQRSTPVSSPSYRTGESVVLCSAPCASQPHNRAATIVRCPCMSSYCPLSSAKQELLATNALVQQGFLKLAAHFRGKLTRDMFITEKVSTLIRTIKDTAKIALSLYLENAPDTATGDPRVEPITLPPAEAQLEARLNVQLRAGLRQLNEIFVQWPAERRLALLRSSPAWRKKEDTSNKRTKSVSLPVTRLATVSRRQFSESVLPRTFRRRSQPTSVATPKIASGDSAVAGRTTNVASQWRTLSLPPPTDLHPRHLGHRLPHALPVCSGGDAQQRNSSTALQRHPFASARATATPRYQCRPRWQPSFLEVPIPPRPIALIDPPAYIDISPCKRRRKIIQIAVRDRSRALLGGGKRGNSPGKQQRGLGAGSRLPISPGATSGGASNRTLSNDVGKSIRPVTTTRLPQTCSATASTAERGVLTEPTRQFSILSRDVMSGPGIVYKNRFLHSASTPGARIRSKSASSFSFLSTVRQRPRHGHQESSQSGVGSNQSNAISCSCMDRSQRLSSISSKPVASKATKTPTAAEGGSQSSEATCPQMHDTGGDTNRCQQHFPVLQRIVSATLREQVAPKQQSQEPSIRPAQRSDEDSCAQQPREQWQLKFRFHPNDVPVVSPDVKSNSSSIYQDRVLRLTWSMESCTVPVVLRDRAELPPNLRLGYL
uniref:Uncharacterized protein n=1 Tax=Schistocephalus solidus TaxID=70667 RepID=A0A0V0J9R7_SCHSO